MHYAGKEAGTREYFSLPCLRCRALVLYFSDEIHEWGKPPGWKAKVDRLHAWCEERALGREGLRDLERLELEGDTWVCAGPFQAAREGHLFCKSCGEMSRDVNVHFGLAHYRNLPGETRQYLGAHCARCGASVLYFEDEMFGHEITNWMG